MSNLGEIVLKRPFYSPSVGSLSFFQVLRRTEEYIDQDPHTQYQLVIGSDSQVKHSRRVDFVTAIIVRRIGRGGIYFWQCLVEERQYFLRDRIYHEALLSLNLAQKFLQHFPLSLLRCYQLEIHVDVGFEGETRLMLNEIVGMIRASGFRVQTKPCAFAAASVADRYT